MIILRCASVLAGAALILAGQGTCFAQKTKGKLAIRVEFDDNGYFTTSTKLDASDKLVGGKKHKVFVATFEKGITYRIDMESAEVDSYLRLYDSSGKLVREDDDGGGGLNARITFKAEETGTFRIHATHYAAKQTGAFKLTIRREDGKPQVTKKDPDKEPQKKSPDPAKSLVADTVKLNGLVLRT